jgi:hypothetical protein
MERQKNQYEKHHGIKWPPIDHFAHNNQPKTGGRDGGEYEGEISRGWNRQENPPGTGIRE